MKKINLPPKDDWEYHHWMIRGFSKDFEPRKKEKRKIARLKPPKHKKSLKSKLWYMVKALPSGTIIDRDWIVENFGEYPTVRKYLMQEEFVGGVDEDGDATVMAIVKKVSNGTKSLIMERV